MRGSVFIMWLASCATPAWSPALMDAEQVEALRPVAPNAVSRAEAAHEEAERAAASGDVRAAGDHQTLARLYLTIAEETGALAEQEQLLAQEEAELEAEAQSLEEEARIAQRLAAEHRLHEAQATATEEARRAYVLASIDEPRRLRRRATAMALARRRATSALLDRAKLISAAATLLGVAAPEDFRESVDGAESESDPTQALIRAQAIHRAAMARLGVARREEGFSMDQCRSFVEMALERDLLADLAPEGVMVRDIELRQAGAIAELLSSFLAGPVILQGDESAALERALAAAEVPESRLQRVTSGGETRLLLPVCGQDAE